MQTHMVRVASIWWFHGPTALSTAKHPLHNTTCGCFQYPTPTLTFKFKFLTASVYVWQLHITALNNHRNPPEQEVRQNVATIQIMANHSVFPNCLKTTSPLVTHTEPQRIKSRLHITQRYPVVWLCCAGVYASLCQLATRS